MGAGRTYLWLHTVLLQLAHLHVFVGCLCQHAPQLCCLLPGLKAGGLQQNMQANN
jgi:hypothetical protein